MDAIAAFAENVTQTRFQELPSDAIKAAKIFILDTFGVGTAGSSGLMACDLADMQGRGEEAPAAAMCNAYQAHNSEFDCLHEEAVVHAMSVVLAVAIAGAERNKGVSGKDLITAVTLGVDLATGLGVAATAGLRFFRPATAGAFGGTAAFGKLMALDQYAMINAFSIAYGQVCGTLQAHTEGTSLLAMQMGFNARNAFVACDLAAHGFDAPKNLLEGPFGYFKLFEAGGSPGRIAVCDPGRYHRSCDSPRAAARASPRRPAAARADERQLCASVRVLRGRLRATQGQRRVRGFHIPSLSRRTDTRTGAAYGDRGVRYW
jgi:aconitate decarboxylase